MVDLDNFIKENTKPIKNIILDLDGCLFNSNCLAKYIPEDKSSREGWDNFHRHYGEISINEEMVKFIATLITTRGLKSIDFVTSREDCNGLRKQTEEQILDALTNVLGLIPNFEKYNIDIRLYMREYEDYRNSSEVKKNILYASIVPFKHIDLAIDDDKENIEMYRMHNIKTLYYDNLYIDRELDVVI